MDSEMLRWLLAAVAAALIALGVAAAALRPSHDRVWLTAQAILPRISFAGDSAHILDVRDFRYGVDGTVTPGYRNESYDLSLAEKVWFVLVPFDEGWRGPAHAFLTFGFRDGRYLSVSIEARREEGEEYSVWKGLLRRYELMYVLGTEEDLIGLRTVVWDDPTYLYPVRATPDQASALLEGLLRRAQQVHDNPEFYNTIGNNCTTNLIDQINRIASRKIRFGREVLLPGYSDELAHRMGLLDTDLGLAEARLRFRINDRARESYPDPNFSERIRSGARLEAE
jgi:hypothetical protein